MNEIEAIALEREKAEEVVDLKIPDFERFERRAGTEIEEFQQLCYPDGQQSGNKTKRKAVSKDNSSSNKKAKTGENSEIGYNQMVQSGQVCYIF